MDEQTRREKAEQLAARLAEAEAERNKKETAVREGADPEHYMELEGLEDRDFLYDEAVKTLRTNIQFSGSANKVIMFTSCVPNEGKSTVTLDIARSLAGIDKRVLFVDADLRKSVFVKRHNIRNKINGLSKYLSGQSDLEDLYYNTSIENLDVVLAGPYAPNPSELLQDKLFAEFIADTRERYDYVLIDTPPMANIIDGAIIATQCDGAIIIVRSGFVSYRGDQRVKEQIEKAGCKIIGAVLNCVEVDNKGRGGYYYDHYYYSNYYGVRHSKSRKKKK